MNIQDQPFEEVLRLYEKAIKKQFVSLRLYKDFDEFYQVGCIALWDAYQQFNPDKGKFSTYAISFIRGRMLTHLTKETTYNERHAFTEEETIELVPSKGGPIPLEYELLEAYLWNLTEKEKTWVYEAIVLQKKPSEIQLTFGTSRNSVHQLKKNALRKMRDNALSLKKVIKKEKKVPDPQRFKALGVRHPTRVTSLDY
ncbi:sigma-70 family RNA polymerase sigma factor [Halalkalibacter akibai]|uniref:RNA polymerase n=1 Tax=Halalkalibacter akibai (strain ATCC 43226 / DSM 21942 / CIP 109018 / JCM 9157 / 1139) TaxID=1236973 RepID=W4QQT1_HALA3|nr:sigma-70 family RNA polymerase sigma factor [Halalkalibacter akibai]GAE33998.1 RNA polymerase [Halalkalibacter akibai JCM 9157]